MIRKLSKVRCDHLINLFTSVCRLWWGCAELRFLWVQQKLCRKVDRSCVPGPAESVISSEKALSSTHQQLRHLPDRSFVVNPTAAGPSARRKLCHQPNNSCAICSTEALPSTQQQLCHQTASVSSDRSCVIRQKLCPYVAAVHAPPSRARWPQSSAFFTQGDGQTTESIFIADDWRELSSFSFSAAAQRGISIERDTVLNFICFVLFFVSHLSEKFISALRSSTFHELIHDERPGQFIVMKRGWESQDRKLTRECFLAPCGCPQVYKSNQMVTIL